MTELKFLRKKKCVCLFSFSERVTTRVCTDGHSVTLFQINTA